MKNIYNYLNLIRFFNQTGTLLLFVPCLFGLALCGERSIFQYILFFVCSFCARSCGCILNDIADTKIDAKITTTSHRPLASGLLNLKQALIFLLCIIFSSAFLLLFLNHNAIIPLIISGVFVIIYPYSKRFFPIPQLFLGTAYSSGSIITICHYMNVAFFELSPQIYLLYTAFIIWVIFFDTIYAKRDFTHDKSHNVRSATIFFEQHSKKSILVLVLTTTIVGYFQKDLLLILPILPATITLFFVKKTEHKAINKVLLWLLMLEISLFSFVVVSVSSLIALTITATIQTLSIFQKPQTGFKLNSIALLPVVITLF